MKALPRVLAAAFSGYQDANRYHTAMLSFFREWMWKEGPSLVLASENDVYGALLGGIRESTFQGTTLRVLHIGPAGIVPRYRRAGHGTEMMRQLTVLAQKKDVDLMSLTTETVYGAHRLYRRAGFDVLEAYRPIVRMLNPVQPNQELPEELTLQEGFSMNNRPQPESTAEPKTIVETGPQSPPLPTRLRPREFQLADGSAKSIQWSVVSRHGEREALVHVTQIVDWNPGNNPDQLLESVCELAAQDASICVYALPSTAKVLPGFTSKGTPLVYRMARGLTEEGKRAVQQADAYCEICPAP
jgi:GNAT superfamily N-acetyltransferase